MNPTSLSAKQPALSRSRAPLFNRRAVLWFVLITVLLVSSRVALRPHHLNTFDDINFALAIDEFNPVHHQPQPPGYPLFVGLLRLGALFIPSVEHLFLAVALLASLLSLVLLWAAGDCLLGRGIGLIAALLLLFHPSFWFAALTNPIRLFLAAGATAVAYCLINALTRERKIPWYYLSAFVLGVAEGFRPFLSITLLPLMIYGAWRLRLRPKQLLLAVLLAALATAAWLIPNTLPVGGLLAFIKLMRNYFAEQGSTTSLLLGAPLSSALQMAYTTTVWTFTGTLSWLWCVPFVLRRGNSLFTAVQLRFLLSWLLPGFLFYAIVHTGDPDHPLSIIPATCLLGAVFLERFARIYGPRLLPWAVAVAVALNALLFFKPINKTAKAGSYKVARWLDGYMNGIIGSLALLESKGPVTVVVLGTTPGWRNVSYYFPHAHTIVISSTDRTRPAAWQVYQRRPVPLSINAGVIGLPACGSIAWLDFNVRPVSSTGEHASVLLPNAALTYTKAAPGVSYEFHGVRLETGMQGCLTPASSAGS